MASPLHRLYTTRLTLFALICITSGIVLLLVAHWAGTQPALNWLKALPVAEVGSAVFTAGLVVIFFEYINRQDAEQRSLEQLRQVLTEAAPQIRDAVVNGFAFAPDSLIDVSSPATLDRVNENCLAIRLGDRNLATDAYTDLRAQVIRAKERWYDVHVSVQLSPWDKGPRSGRGSMFVATIQWEYRLKPVNPIMRFACVSDLDEYRELLQDPSSTEAWYFEPIDHLDGSSPEAFELLQFTVDGKPRTARRSTRRSGQVYSVNLGADVMGTQNDVTISYTYRTLVQQSGHLLHLDLAQPTKGFTVSFSYANCGIRYVNVLDYIAGARQPRISQLPATDPAASVEVSFGGWVFPKGGVAFVWVMEAEMGSTLQSPRRPKLGPVDWTP